MNFLFLLLINYVFAQTNCKQRKEIRDLTSIELSQFNSNFILLYKKPEFKQFVKIHSTLFPLIHNTPAFLPFHRLYLQEFENNFMINMTFGVPWIDWTIDAKNVSDSIVFTKDFLGSNDIDGNIKNTNYANITIAFPETEILKL